MLNNISLFALTIVIMTGLALAGIAAGYIVSHVRLKRFLKVFNEDIKRPVKQVNQSN
jgi:hypothetical protein